jgi:hypothetical protein
VGAGLWAGGQRCRRILLRLLPAMGVATVAHSWYLLASHLLRGTHDSVSLITKAYQRLLVNSYCIFDLCRPRGRSRPPSASCDRRAFALTCSGDNINLHNFGSAYDEWHMNGTIDRVLFVTGALLPSPAVAPTSTSIILDARTMNGTSTECFL